VGRQTRPEGTVTRGTTHPNRLRRVDRWLIGVHGALLSGVADPLVADLGYGASPITVVELHRRLAAHRADVEVVGIEIEPARVAVAEPLARPGLSFVVGGFELPMPSGRRPVIVRAFNVLRQYAEEDVAGAWARMAERLAPGGLLVEGTCDELGRLASWVSVDAGGLPTALTLSLRLAGLERPGQVAARLPKALIHRNVPGEPVHTFLTALDDAWTRAVDRSGFGARQRWLRTVAGVRAEGWPVLGGPARWRLGELSVPWTAVAPAPDTRPTTG